MEREFLPDSYMPHVKSCASWVIIQARALDSF